MRPYIRPPTLRPEQLLKLLPIIIIIRFRPACCDVSTARMIVRLQSFRRNQIATAAGATGIRFAY